MITDEPVTYKPIVPDGSKFKDLIKQLKRINKEGRILEVKEEVHSRSKTGERITTYGCKTMGKPLTTKLTFIIQEP